ncbi:MAG: DUF3552 domain-containing protein, partial [Firmicutes bacterium]|nr:DUF3552 domain-containing protein [Bacillota bacterium]
MKYNRRCQGLGILKLLLIVGFASLCFFIIGFILGQIWRKKTAEGTIGSAEREAENIKLEAKKAAEEIKRAADAEKKEILLSAQ